MLSTLKRFLELLDADERRRFWWLQVWVAVQGVTEAISTVAVVPFIHILSDPTVIERSTPWIRIKETTGLRTAEALTTASGVALVGALLTANAVSAVIAYRRTLFTHGLLSSVPTRLFQGYLARDYAYFLRIDTSTLAKNILSETNEFVDHFVSPMMKTLARVLPALMVAGAVLVVDWRVMAGLVVMFGGAYVAMDAVTRRRQRVIGAERIKANERRHRVLGEAFGAIKEVKLFGAETYQVKRFEPAAKAFAAWRARNRATSETALYVLQSLLVGGLIFFSLVLLVRGTSVADAAPVVGLLAMALLRLIPTMNDLFRNSMAFHFNAAAVDNLANQIRENEQAVVPVTREQRMDRLVLNRELVLDRVSYRYHDDRPFSLREISIQIPSRATLGIVGRSGAGKSTLADLLLGLLEPQSGTMSVDGRVLDRSNRWVWRQSVGYVPQVINLVNASVYENIACGVDPSEIDRLRVEEVASLADLHAFITTQLPLGYDTPVGERGVRFSGGQRQRIGIARALYRNPTLLVFDEATNSLDLETETAVLDAIGRLSGQKTLVLISHRRSTLMGCDRVIRMDAGRLTDEAEPSPLDAPIITALAHRHEE